MTLRVLSAGLHSLVVDHGRPGSRSLGVPVGGAADHFALAIGNALVGNPPDAAALEVSLLGPTLQATRTLACVVYGAPFRLGSDRQTLPAGKTFTLTAGETLTVGGTPEGVRAYLCVRGGLDVKAVLGSRSGLVPVREGDDLPCTEGTLIGRFLRVSPDGPEWGERRLPSPRVLRFLDGPQRSWFPAETDFDDPAADFTITPDSNRMGLRLQGPPLAWPGREMVSEPVCPGTVQVTPDGRCIVLGVDAQTIGGYPKLAQVIGADLDLLGQLRPGDRVQFRRLTLDEAERLRRDRQALLRHLLVRIAAVVAG
jgi:antagonist of KipI